MQNDYMPVPLQKPFDADFDPNSRIRQRKRQNEVVLTNPLTDHSDIVKETVKPLFGLAVIPILVNSVA